MDAGGGSNGDEVQILTLHGAKGWNGLSSSCLAGKRKCFRPAAAWTKAA